MSLLTFVKEREAADLNFPDSPQTGSEETEICLISTSLSQQAALPSLVGHTLVLQDQRKKPKPIVTSARAGPATGKSEVTTSGPWGLVLGAPPSIPLASPLLLWRMELCMAK